MNNPFIIGEKIYLRSPEPSDENIIALSENHPDPRETLFYSLPTSPEEQKTRIKSHMEDHKTIFLMICDKQTDKAIVIKKITNRSAVLHFLELTGSDEWQFTILP